MISRTDIPAWVDEGVCASVDPTLFDQGSTQSREAKTICADCPVIDLCRDYAVKDASLEGIWGGTTEYERRRMRAELNIRRTTQCGTVAGYKRHISRRATPCDPCKAANAKYQRDRRSGPPVDIPWTSTHGTEAGYKAHRRRGEAACQSCATAARNAKRERKARAS